MAPPLPPGAVRRLYSARRIQRRVRELAHQIRDDIAAEPVGAPTAVYGILEGAFMLAADFARAMAGSQPLVVGFVAASTSPKWKHDASENPAEDVDVTVEPVSDRNAKAWMRWMRYGHHVVIVDVMMSSGATLAGVEQWVAEELNPVSVRRLALLSCPPSTPRPTDYIGWRIAPMEVAGYGSDWPTRAQGRSWADIYEMREEPDARR